MRRGETASGAGDALPRGFHDLAPFIGRALATEYERMAARETSTMAALQAFYDAMIGRLPEIVAYLDQFSLVAMPEEARLLLNMALSLTEASIAVK